MKKQTIILSLLSIIGFLTGCSENDELNSVLDGNAPQATNVISGTGSIDFGEVGQVLMNAPQTRTATHYKNGGLNYGWKKRRANSCLHVLYARWQTSRYRK